MLDKFKKFKFFSEVKEPEMEQEDTQADLSAVDVNEQLAAANEALASNAVAMKEMGEKLAEMSAKFDAAQTALAAVEAEKAAMLAEATEKKLSARKEKIVASIGTAKAEGVMAATKDLDDAQFEAIVSALATSIDAEAKSEMFTETGASAEADASKIVDPVEKLAANLAAQFNPK